MFITWYQTLIFNSALEFEANKSKAFNDTDSFILGAQCCVADLSDDRKGYLASLQIDKDTIDDLEFDHVEQKVMDN